MNIRTNISVFLFLYSAGALLAAYISQFGFGMEPCILCLYQRIPFFVVLLVSALSLLVKGKKQMVLVAFCGVMLLVGAGIAFFHVGVEHGYFELGNGCEVGASNASTLEEMTTELLGKPNVPCDKPQFVFLGVSMAGWNFLFSSFFGVMTLVMAFRKYVYKE